MKFTDIIPQIKRVDLLNEALLDNKRLMDELRLKWAGKVTDKEFPEIIKWFDRNKNILKPTITTTYTDPADNQQKINEKPYPPVSKLLNRYPNFGRKNGIFDPKKLLEIKEYSGEEILFLYREFVKASKTVELDVFTTVPTNPNPTKFDLRRTDAKIIASKSLWNNSKNDAIIVEGPVRVFQIKNQQESINFGYYLQTMYPKTSTQRKELVADDSSQEFANIIGSQWCTTRVDIQSGSNLYFTYRPTASYYFVIDDSKNPFVLRENNDESKIPGTDKWKGQFYLCCITVKNNGYIEYTPVQNGTVPTSWNFMESVYPQLSGHKDKFVFIPMDRNKEAVDPSSTQIMLTEAIGPHCFAYAPLDQQEHFIETLRAPLSKALSWQHMTADLKKKYINLTVETTIRERFSSYELLLEIEKNNQDVKDFNHRMKVINGKSLAEMLGKSLRNSGQFEVWKKSIENPNLELWKTGDKYGIFDTSNQGHVFYQKDGVTYNPHYVLADEFVITAEGKDYWVEYFTLYHKENREQLKSHFYLLTDIDKMEGGEAHFYTYDNFTRMKEEYGVNAQGDSQELEKIDKGDIEEELG